LHLRRNPLNLTQNAQFRTDSGLRVLGTSGTFGTFLPASTVDTPSALPHKRFPRFPLLRDFKSEQSSSAWCFEGIGGLGCVTDKIRKRSRLFSVSLTVNLKHPLPSRLFPHNRSHCGPLIAVAFPLARYPVTVLITTIPMMTPAFIPFFQAGDKCLLGLWFQTVSWCCS
jgi:hypothetical protein